MKLELKKKVKSKISLSSIFLFSILTLVALIVPTVLAGKPCGGTKIQDGILTYSPGHYLEGVPLKVGYDIFGYNYQAHKFNGSYANAYLGRDGFPPYEGDDENYLDKNPFASSTWYWPYRNTRLIMKWNDAWLANMDCDGDGLLDRHYGFDSYIGSGAWLTNHMWESYWNMVNQWNLVFVRDDGEKFPHTWTVSNQVNGQFEGIGVSGIHDYTFKGTIEGNEIEFLAEYGETLPGYTYLAQGIILPDGSLTGTWVGSNGRYGDWYSVSGGAIVCEWNYFVKIIAAPENAYLDNGVWYASDETKIGPAIWGEFAIIQEVENDPCAGIEGMQYISPDHAGLGGW